MTLRRLAIFAAISATITAAVTVAVFAQGQPANDPGAQALAMIQEAQRNYRAAVKDYTCVFVNKENLVKGKPGEDQIIQMKFREQPFSVAMKWVGPKQMTGQEAVFVQGKNENKLRVQSKGILGVAGFVSIPTDDPRVKQSSRHTIHEAGIGNLIDTTAKHWDFDRRSGKTHFRINEFEFDGRRCYRVETIRTEKLPQFYCFRSVMFLEKNSKYPLRNENYDWPVQGGPPEGELLEAFSYTGLQFNQNLTDKDFDR